MGSDAESENDEEGGSGSDEDEEEEEESEDDAEESYVESEASDEDSAMHRDYPRSKMQVSRGQDGARPGIRAGAEAGPGQT